jgi:hypothetical protein
VDYYSRKSLFYRELRAFIFDRQNTERKVPIERLELIFAQRFGFTKNSIIKALQPFIKFGYAELIDDVVLIHGKPQGKPAVSVDRVASGSTAAMI